MLVVRKKDDLGSRVAALASGRAVMAGVEITLAFFRF